LLHKLSNFGLSDCYINWDPDYLSSGVSVVRTLGKSSSPFPTLWGLPQGSNLEPLLFNMFNKDLRAKIHFSEFLLFADLKILRVIKSAEDFILLQIDIDSIYKWCIEDYMKINIFKTNMISFTRKTNSIHFYYFLGDLLIWTDCVTGLEVM
jgi:hypothetical protein